MRNHKIFSAIFLLCCGLYNAVAAPRTANNYYLPIPSKDTSKLFNQADLKKIPGDFSFTEGCSVNKAGDVFFTDQPNNKIWKYTMDGQLSVFLGQSGRANGTYFDSKGNLITCSDDKGEIWSVNSKGKVKVLVKDLNGKQLNGPNDVWIDEHDGLYFTDPYYQRPYWERKSPALDHENVYYLAKGSKDIKMVAGDLKKPNGIVGTPDGKTLYVADIGAGKTYAYTINSEGVLSNGKVIINRGSDGMTIDSRGNLYLSGKGIAVYNPEGKLIAEINVPEGTTNVCFAGKDRNVLFITARTAIYVLPMNVRGVE